MEWRDFAKAIGAFLLGGCITLLFEWNMGKMPMIVLIIVAIIGVLLLIVGYAPEVKHWWWMRNQTPMQYDLVVQLTGTYGFLASLPEWDRSLFSVTWDKKFPNKFAVYPGERVKVTGKLSKRMTDGLNELIECRVE